MATGGEFYDDPEVFTRYAARRSEPANPNDTMALPALLDAIGDVAGRRVLDLGCGDAALGRRLLSSGGASYHGVDGSQRMVEAARRILAGTIGTVERRDLEMFEPFGYAYDLVVSQLALHYVADLDRILDVCAGGIDPGGRIVLSVIHPAITSHDNRRDGEDRTDWTVDDYFVAGPRRQRWLGGEVDWHHRTVETYVATLLGAGFTLDHLSECAPRPEHMAGTELDRRRRVPLFLLLAGTRRSPADS